MNVSMEDMYLKESANCIKGGMSDLFISYLSAIY